MCAAAHGWVGLGRIVFPARRPRPAPGSPISGRRPRLVRAIPIQDVAPGVTVEGPVPGLDDEVHELHRRYRLSR